TQLVRDVVVGDHIAYVANWHSGLQAVDIHTPTAPVVVASVASFVVTESVALARGLVFTSEQSGGIMVVDATHPTSVAPLAVLPVSASHVATNGTTTSVVGVDGLHTVQFSGGTPVQVGQLPFSDDASQVLAAGNNVFIYHVGPSMTVVDIS